jgi:hypothetical protein
MFPASTSGAFASTVRPICPRRPLLDAARDRALCALGIAPRRKGASTQRHWVTRPPIDVPGCANTLGIAAWLRDRGDPLSLAQTRMCSPVAVRVPGTSAVAPSPLRTMLV